MKIFAIVVTYNGSKWIEKCLTSLIHSSIQLHIIVIDNFSTDRTISIIEEKFSEVTLIKSPKNLGFGKANNKGIKYALEQEADYVFLLNQDAWVEKETIEKLVEVHQNHPQFGILSPVPYDGDGVELDYLYNKYHKNKIIYRNEFTNRTFEIKFINAAAWLMSLDLIKQIGGFHPKFVMYGEDTNYIDRVRFHGKFKIGITMKANYFHDRQYRKIEKDTLNRRLSKLKTKYKCYAFNPNRKFFEIRIKNIVLSILKGKEPKIYWRILLYTVKMYVYSLGDRKVYYRLNG